MRSSSGEYYEHLDHLRGLAAFLVFTWHFTHMPGLIPPSHVPILPLSIFEEGHTGVALFMTLSGYLFAKLLAGHLISYPAFIWNRFVRLAPLLIFVLGTIAVIQLWHGARLTSIVHNYAVGVILPRWPSGAWSIAVEGHFYLVLPILIWALTKNVKLTLIVIGAAIALRASIYGWRGEVREAAYWTIIGRIDQFVLGIAACLITRTHKITGSMMVGATIAFLVAYHRFNLDGGWLGYGPLPTLSTSPIWIVMPTIEGCFYALLIAFYDRSKPKLPRVLARPFVFAGTVSYSVYLLHILLMERVVSLFNVAATGLTSYPLALTLSVPAFALMCLVAWAPYRLIERPFLRLRMSYRRSDVTKSVSYAA